MRANLINETGEILQEFEGVTEIGDNYIDGAYPWNDGVSYTHYAENGQRFEVIEDTPPPEEPTPDEIEDLRQQLNEANAALELFGVDTSSNSASVLEQARGLSLNANNTVGEPKSKGNILNG